MITHFQFKETKGKDYFRKAWSFSFNSHGQIYTGVYHQDGTVDWNETDPTRAQPELLKELHRLMSFHVFR